jgi:hypothetical protein
MAEHKKPDVVHTEGEKASSHDTSKSYHGAFDFWGLTPFLNDTFAVKSKPWLKATKEGWVHWLPRVMFIFIVLGVFAFLALALAALGVSSLGLLGAAFDGGATFLTGIFIWPVVLFLGVYLYFLNQIRSDLAKKLARGWVWLYYLTLINIVFSLLRFDIVPALFEVFQIWVLFQIKEYYK